MDTGFNLQTSSAEKREKAGNREKGEKRAQGAQEKGGRKEKGAYSASDDVGANARERDVDNHVRLACEQA